MFVNCFCFCNTFWNFQLSMRLITGAFYMWQLKYNLEILIAEFYISTTLIFHSVPFWKACVWNLSIINGHILGLFIFFLLTTYILQLWWWRKLIYLCWYYFLKLLKFLQMRTKYFWLVKLELLVRAVARFVCVCLFPLSHSTPRRTKMLLFLCLLLTEGKEYIRYKILVLHMFLAVWEKIL